MRTSPSRPTRTSSQPAYLSAFVTEVLSHRNRSSQAQAVPAEYADAGPARRTRGRAANQNAQHSNQHDRAGAAGGGEGTETVSDGEVAVNGVLGEGGQGDESEDVDSGAGGGGGEGEGDLGGQGGEGEQTLAPAVGVVLGERLDITPFRDPAIPEALPPSPEQELGDGWAAIDRIDPRLSMIVEGGVMEEVPRQHRQMYAWAMGVVLERIVLAISQNSTLSIDRALRWLIFLPQALLRNPKERGKEGRGFVAARFNCLAERRWGELVRLWESDREHFGGATVQGVEQESEEERREKCRREVMKQLGLGSISRAVDRITSHGVADMADPDVKRQMIAKHPARSKDMQTSVIKDSPVSNLRGLKQDLLNLKSRKGSSPGAGGCRPEFLVTLAETLQPDRMELLEEFGMYYLRAELPPWFYKVFLSNLSIALYKDNTRGPVRPLGVKHQLVRSFHRRAVTENKSELISFLEPQQLALSPAGCTKLYMGLRMKMEARQDRADWVAVKLDVKNAFNSASRACLVQRLEREPTLAHLASLFAVTTAAAVDLVSGGEKWGEMDDGFSQGDPLAGPGFCISWHGEVVELDTVLAGAGGGEEGMARCICDDVYAEGPAATVFPAIIKFERDINENCGLTLQRTKCEVFSWSGELPPGCPDGFTKAGMEVDGVWEPGFMCVGAPFGSDAYCKAMLDNKVNELEEEIRKAKDLLCREKQALWTCLRASFSHKLEYWLAIMYPSLVRDAALRVDKLFWGVLEDVAGSHLPEVAGTPPCTCCIGVEGVCPVLPEQIPTQSFQHWVFHLPVKQGGLGIRSQLFLSPFAYYGAIEQVIPYFGGEKGICPSLANLYNVEQGVDKRWESLVRSGSRAGVELQEAWIPVKERLTALCEYLEEEVPTVLAGDVVGLGEGRTDGSSRALMVKEYERLQAAALNKSLKEHRDQKLRMVVARRNTDKISTAFLLLRPGPHSSINNIYFSEHILTLLAVPSVICRGKVGERIGNMKVDKWGDSVLNATVQGNHFKATHDAVKNSINSLLKYAGIVSEVEPYGVFADLIPQQPLNRVQGNQARQSIIPDIRADLPDPELGTKRTYMEIKTVSGAKWYQSVREKKRAVERRVAAIGEEYEDNAKAADAKYFGVHDGQGQGPVSRRLALVGPIFGIAAGRFGELSDSGQALVTTMAEARVRKQELAWGRGEDEEKSSLAYETSYIRRRLSLAIVVAFGQRLASRMNQVGKNGALASKRRQWWSREEQMAKLDREAAWLEKVQGQNIISRGRFWRGAGSR